MVTAPAAPALQEPLHRLKPATPAYPKLQIIHRAGRVHSNVDPISRLRQRVPFQSGPSVDATKHIILDPGEDPLKDMYTALGSQFEKRLLKVASNFVTQELNESADYSKIISDTLEHDLPQRFISTF